MSSANQEENAKDSLEEIENQTSEDSDSQAYTETGEEDIENDNLEKMILSTGIRVGTYPD